MRLTYDPRSDVLYIRLRSAERHDREELDGGASIDYDVEGYVIGLELTSARQRLSLEDLTTVTYENVSIGRRSRLTLP